MTKRGAGNKGSSSSPKPRASKDDVHRIVYFKTEDGAIPGREFLEACPDGIQDRFRAILLEVAKAPPHRFSGGGYWEAMKPPMNGWYEVRVDGPPNRTHYRLFCLLDYDDATAPRLVIIAGRKKRFKTTLAASDYADVSKLGDAYWLRHLGSVV